VIKNIKWHVQGTGWKRGSKSVDILSKIDSKVQKLADAKTMYEHNKKLKLKPFIRKIYYLSQIQ
jgi:hypothetical protein